MTMDTLISQLELLNFNTEVIKHTNWKIDDIARLMSDNMNNSDNSDKQLVIIFDIEEVGCGELIELYPTKMIEPKWQDGYGLVYLVNNKNVSFTVAPKQELPIECIKKLMNVYNKCSQCNEYHKHIKIDRFKGNVYCIKCFNDSIYT